MSRIDDALQQINQYLDSSNIQYTPEIQSALQCYTTACRDLNSKLVQCSQLIMLGSIEDARKLDLESTPPLSVRAQRLALAPEKSARLRELCKLWGCSELPSPDTDTAAKLQNSSEFSGQQLQQLINSWRKTARTGSAPDKARLLRNIINCKPEDINIWRDNLSKVEKQWKIELFAEADSALASGNIGQLEQLYMALSSSDFIEPVPESSLSKYQSPIKALQQKRLSEAIFQKQQDIHNAHSAQNTNLLEQYLQEYDLLKTHPLCPQDQQSENSINEARQYLQRETEYNNNLKRYNTLLARLNNALEKSRPFPEISTLYESLCQTDLPIDTHLSRRIDDLREEYLRENQRKHLRKCLYGFLAAILIFTAGFFTVNLLQHRQSVKNHRMVMEEMFNSGNYQGVLDLHEKIRQESPKLLQSTELTAWQQKAAQARQAQLKRFHQIGEIFNAFDDEISTGKNLHKLRQIKSVLDKIQSDDLPENMALKKQSIELALNKLEYENQQNTDRMFIRQFDKYLQALEQCRQALQKDPLACKTVPERLKDIDSQARSLLQKHLSVNKNILNSKKSMLEKQLKDLTAIAEAQQARKNLESSLNKPVNFANYCNILEKLPVQAPDLAEKSWAIALKNLNQTKALTAAAELCSQDINNSGDLDNALAELPYNLSGNCFVRDMKKLLPDKFFRSQIQHTVNNMSDELQQIYDCYELVFEDANGICWRFYSKQMPVKESGRTTRIPKTIALNVMLSLDKDGHFMPIQVVRRKARQYGFYPGKLPGTALPESFTELKGQDLANIKMNKSQHSIFLNQLINELQHASSPDVLEKILLRNLEKLFTDESMNIWAKTAIALRLLEMLPTASPCYEQPELRQMTVNLTSHSFGKLDKWYIPTAEAEYPEQVKELKKLFKNFNLELLKNIRKNAAARVKLALDRTLMPGGIIIKNANGSCRLHWFDGMEGALEIWFYTVENSGKNVFNAYSRKDICNPADNSLQKLNGQKFYNGMVFFVPQDNRSTSQLTEQLLRDADSLKLPTVNWPESWPENIR